MGILRFAMLAFSLLGSTDAAMPPAALEPMAIGFAQGFVSDGPEVANCGQLALGDILNFENAVKDLRKGITGFNATEIEDALKEIKDVIAGIPIAEKTCKRVEADLKLIISSLKEIKGPKDLVLHIVNHLFDDSEKIFDELAAAEHAYKTGWDYMTAGNQLGMSVRRLLIGDAGDAPPAPPAPGAKKEMIEGVALGFLSDGMEIMKCSEVVRTEASDLEQFASDLVHGLRHLNGRDIKEAVEKLEAFVNGIASTKMTCKAVSIEIKHNVHAIISVLKEIRGPKDLVLHIIDNFLGDGEKIFGELSAAGVAYKKAEYTGSGRQIGMALRRMLVGEAMQNSTKLDLVVV